MNPFVTNQTGFDKFNHRSICTTSDANPGDREEGRFREYHPLPKEFGEQPNPPAYIAKSQPDGSCDGEIPEADLSIPLTSVPSYGIQQKPQRPQLLTSSWALPLSLGLGGVGRPSSLCHATSSPYQITL